MNDSAILFLFSFLKEHGPSIEKFVSFVKVVEKDPMSISTLVYDVSDYDALVNYGQCNKSGDKLFDMWKQGLLNAKPGLHYRSKMGSKIERDVGMFNRLVVVCAKLLELERSEYSLIKFYISENKYDNELFLEQVMTKNYMFTPIYSIDINQIDRDLPTYKSSSDILLIEEMSKHVDRDLPCYIGKNGFITNDGSMDAMLFIDGTGVTFSEDGEDKMSDVLDYPVNLKLSISNPVAVNPSYDQTPFSTVMECFSDVTIMY